MHNVALYRWSRAQYRFHIPTETDNTALYTIKKKKKKLIINMQNRLVHHLISAKLHCALPNVRGNPHFSWTWCTMQPGGAQCRSMVHNVGLTNPDGWMDAIKCIISIPCFAVDDKNVSTWKCWIIKGEPQCTWCSKCTSPLSYYQVSAGYHWLNWQAPFFSISQLKNNIFAMLK